MGILVKPIGASSKRDAIRDVLAGGVPAKYTKLTTNTTSQNIVKGQTNKIKIFPRIVNAHVENAEESQGIVSSNNIVGQVFKANKDNITALFLTLESADSVSVNNFEGYADSSALQVDWIKEGVNDAELETTIVGEGSKSMSLSGHVANDAWHKDIVPSDYTNHTFGLDFRQDKEYDRLKYEFFIGDGVTTKHFSIVIVAPNRWEHFEININSMIEDSGTVDVMAITEIGFRVVDKEVNKIGYVDNVTVTPPPGELEIKLWNMGTSIPVSNVTSIDSGVQYEKLGIAELSSYILTLESGKHLYHMKEFNAGQDKSSLTNELLIIDNYYIIELKYVDTNVTVYGSKDAFSTDFYKDGFAFNTSGESIGISAAGQYSDLMFGIMSRQAIYLTKIAWRFDAQPGEHSQISVFLEDAELTITDMVIDCEHDPDKSFVSDLSRRPMLVKDGGKIEYSYNDDFSDSVTKVNVELSFLHVPYN